MNSSWKNTREALRNFANVLICYKCGNKPVNVVRYTNCGHSFCKQCIENDVVCRVCNTPVEPLEISNDHLVKGLVSYCDIIAELIHEKNLWDGTTKLSGTQLSTTTRIKSEPTNIKYNIPKKNINKKNGKGETPLHTACVKNQAFYVKALLDSGANPNTKDYTGWTPLQEAVNFGYADICQLLLECGAAPNTPGAGNRRPLHDAVMNNRLLEARTLLQHAANKNVYDDQGKRPIDYSKPHSEMWNILKDEEDKSNNAADVTMDINSTLNQSLSTTHSFDPYVIYVSKLQDENRKYLAQMVLKHKIKVISVFRPSVTHVIVETNNENVVQLSYDVMMALLHGTWILNTEWIQLHMDMIDVLKGDVEVFEVSGAPIKGTPRKARENAQNQNPGLFNHCYFYFALQYKNTYYINNVELTRDTLISLVRIGGGTILKREPNPEDITVNKQLIPFHVANKPEHSLYKCTYFIIYAPEEDKPRIKYNMPHIKTLPLMWLIECIEKFTLIDPKELGLLKC